MIPLYRDARCAAQLRRDQKRQRRRENGNTPSRAKRMLSRLVSGP